MELLKTFLRSIFIMENDKQNPQTLNFSDTGIISDDKDRTAITPGMKFIINKIMFKPSEKYNEIATIDAKTGEAADMELNLYTASQVLVKQLHKIQEKYGSIEGAPLNTFIQVEVLSRESESGQKYLSFT